MRLEVRKPSVFALHTSHLSPLTSGPRTWAQRVGTMNRPSALDLKSPLERGVDGSIVDGVCARPAKARMFSGRKRPTGEEVRAP
jgi:hypothetical protein